MRTVYRCSRAFIGGAFAEADVLVSGGVVERIGRDLAGDAFVDFRGLTVFPGLVDVHVHFREPGFSYKETIGAGSRAAADASLSVRARRYANFFSMATPGCPSHSGPRLSATWTPAHP